MGECKGLFHPLQVEKGSVLSRLMEYAVFLFAVAMSVVVMAQSVQEARTEHGLGWNLVALMAAAGVMFCLWGVGKLRWSGRTLLCLTIALAFGLRLLYVLLVQTPPESDFVLMYSTARQIAGLEGAGGWQQPGAGYFYWWGYQIPFVLYEAAVLKIVPSIWALKGMNLLLTVGVDLLIFLIGRLFLSEKAAVAVTFLYAIYPGAIYLVSVLTNQHISLFFLLLGVWLMLAHREWYWMLLSGACLALGDLMRPEGVMILLTTVFCGIWFALRAVRLGAGRSDDTQPGALRIIGKRALSILLALVAFWSVSQATGAALKGTGIAPYGIANRRPEWKFVLGLDFTSRSGGYSEKNAHILSMEDDAQRAAEMRRIVVQSLEECDNVPAFLWRKTKAMWGVDEPVYWSRSHVTARGGAHLRVTQGLEIAGKAIYLVVWGLFAWSAVWLWRHPDRRKNGAALFCMAAVCATFCIYLLIEVQPRYRYFIMPMLFLAAGAAFDGGYGREAKRKKEPQTQVNA